MYKHLTSAQRYIIHLLCTRHASLTFIAKELNVSVSTISREIKRNSGKRGYYPQLAEEMAQERKERLCYNHTIKPYVKTLILHYLTEEQWSPRQISGYLRREGISVSHEYIYALIRKDKQHGGSLYKHLRHRGKHRKRQVGMCCHILGRVSIHERPIEAVGTRFGDFELDTIIGKDGKGVIVTLVERSTNYMMMKKSKKGKDAREIAQIVQTLLLPYKHYIKTITTDNGIEFSGHQEISRVLGVPVYFTDPYSSWQKGCIENTNKLIRQYIPKGTDFDEITDDEILHIQYKLNRRPRLKLNFCTPKDCFFKHFY